MLLQNQVAIITGASRGIGREIALYLSKEKVRLALVARSLSELQQLAADINRQGGHAIGIQADISDSSDVKAVIGQTLREFRHIDILINNAGIGIFKPTEAIQESEWDRMMDVNVKGSFLMSKGVIQHMRSRKQGHIINIASHASRRTFEQGSVYCASKYAQDAFSSVLRKEMRKYGIKVSSIYPGQVDTYFNNTQQPQANKKGWLKPSDVADSVVYILKSPPRVAIDELVINPVSEVY